MCGIAGIIGSKASEEVIHRMLDVQKHRGPDYAGIWSDGDCVLGHNRLAIIDLSPEANQPFIDSSERYILIFNGEVYNYLELKKQIPYNFTTNSDTEVVLAAYIHWGKDCLQKMNGMFSFAIWDQQNKTLFAARDRFGVKPFYYHLDENNFAFASEIKTLHTYGIEKVMNEKVWASYFAFGSYGLPNETFWQGIDQLPGGHYLEYKNDTIFIEKWYHFEEEIKKYSKRLAYEEAKTKYEDLLKDSIKLRFRADVPVGFNVSGGLDSSTLLSFVNQHEKGEHINAFTFYTNDNRYDELPWVQKMIDLTENPLIPVLLNSEEIEGLSQKIAWHQDEPYGGLPTIAYSKIFKTAREQGVIVLLDGQGMDEQWAGYDYYFKSENHNVIQGVTSSPFKTRVFSNEFLDQVQKPDYPKPFKDDLLNKQYRDLFFTKIPRALRFNDRISMAFSTELREPFLDYRLVEFAFAQPKEYKIQDGIQKKLLRDLVSKYLGDDITYAPKRPLQTPQREWLANELSQFVSESIQKIASSEFAHWFDSDNLQQEWHKYLDGDQDSSFHIWQWLSLSMLIQID